MSGNNLDFVCDEDKMIAYIYEDVDDSDIFATEPLLNTSFADSDPKSDSELVIAQNPELTQQQEELKILVEKLQKEKETLLLRISELHKTAKAEFERKNNRIRDLEKEKDNILFRRGNNIFRSKPPDADTRVPVMQQVEKDLTNEEFQNFNTRYRIPKKKSDTKEINEIGTEIDEESKKLKEYRQLENKNTYKEKIKNEKYWSAYPKDKASKSDISKSTERNNKENAEKNNIDSCSGRILSPQDTDDTDKNRQYRVRGSNMDKDSNDRSRPREKLDSRKSIKKESKAIRSPNNEHRTSVEEREQKNVQTRSKSFSRYRGISPDNHVKQPRSPSRERSQEQHQRYHQLKTIDGDIEPEHRRIHSNLTSRSRKSRSPSNEHIFKFSENNSIIKKSIPSRSKSEGGRFKPHSPEYRIRQPRTPSGESSRSSSRNRDTKSRKSRGRSRTRSRVNNCRPTTKENEYVHTSTSRYKSGSKDEDTKPRYNKEHSRQVNRIRSRDRNTTYSRRDSRSQSREKKDICERNRLNSRDKAYKDQLDHKLGSSNRNNDYRNKSEDNEVSSSRSNEGKIGRDDKSSQCQDKGLLQSSSRDKADLRKYSERLDSKIVSARDIKPQFDLREKCQRRSKSYARERYSRRRGVKPDNSRSARNERRFHQDRSRSSSVEIAGNRRFNHNGESLVDNDRHGNLANYKYRNRSNSKERPLNYNIQELQNSDGKSRPRNFGRLKEKLLRHSVDRGRSLREDKHPDKNIDKRNVHMNNDVECSDLDIQLHLSGDSDIDTFNIQDAMEHRDDLISIDTDFDLLKNLAMDYENMTDDQIERLLEERKDAYHKVSSDAHHIFDQEENLNAKFSDCEIKLTDNEEEDNGGQIQRNNKKFLPLIDVEELDYEPNQSGLRQSVKHCLEGKIEHIKSEQNNSSVNFRIVQQNKTLLLEETPERYEEIIKVQQSTNSAECHSKNNITIYGARQQQKKRDHNKGTKSSQIHRTNTQLLRSEDANSILEKNSIELKKSKNHTHDGERKYQRQYLEIKHENCVSEPKDSVREINQECHGNGQEMNKDKTIYLYNDLFRNIQAAKQECTSTRQEICHTRSKVTKAALNKKDISEDAIDKLKDEEETGENENQFKTDKVEEKDVAMKKKEKITLHAYKSRKRSTSEVDINDVIHETVPEINQITTNVPTKYAGEIKSTMINNDNVPPDQVNLPINRLPNMEVGTQEIGENKPVTNPLMNEEERFVQSDEQTVKKIENKEKGFDKAPNQSDSNIPLENSLVVEDVITDNISKGVVEDPENRLKPKTYIYKDPNNFLHDFSISDEDDNANNEEPDQEEVLPEESKKIKILSDITILSPSYTPPHPPPQVLKSEFKETKGKNSRKSLFKDYQSTNEAERVVTDIHRNEEKMNHHSGGNVTSLPDAVENIPRVPESTSRKTINPRPRDSSECMDAIQQAVNNIVEDTFEHISLSTTSNVITEKLDTEELQKCLEEDIPKPDGEKLGNLVTGTKKEIQGQVCTTKLVKNKNCSKETNDEHVDETQKTEQNRETNNGDMLKETFIDGSKETIMEQLFGVMTPSPCKTMREISKEKVNKNKVKRNIAKCEQINDNKDLKIRGKIEGTNRKVSDKKIIDKTDRDAKPRDIRNINKSADESKYHVTIIPPEEVKKCEELNQAVEEMTKKAFCSNPTYICDRNTLGKVFDSPNHYIQKKNQELKEKVRQNLNKKMPSNKEKAFPESIAMDEHHLIENPCIGEGNAEPKKLKETKTIKRPKHQKHKGKRKTICDEESSEGEEAKHNKPKDKTKRGKKNLDNKNTEENENLPLTHKQSKKHLTQSSCTDDKKTRNSSFKIKIKRPKSVAKKKIRNKKRSLLDTESSDSFEEPYKLYQKEQTVKEETSSGVANVANNKRSVEEKELIQDIDVPEDQSLSNSQLGHIRNIVETESRKIRASKKEKKSELKGIKRKRTVKAQNKEKNENCQEEIKVEQSSKRLNNGQDNNNFANSEEIKISSEVMKATESNSKEKMENINNMNTKSKDASFEDKSVSSSTTTTSNECVTEPVKTIKRITPKRIDDSSVISEKELQFMELKGKRELFIENPESININNKRERLSSSGDDCRPEVKRSKISLTESIITTEEASIDNGAHTQIKVSESKTNIELVLLSTTTDEKYIIHNESQMKVLDSKVDKEVTPLVGPHSSPLYNFEQTFDTLSRRCEAAATSDSRPVNAANSHLQVTKPHEGADTELNDTFSEIQYNNKDREFIRSIDKHSFSQLSIFSMSNKSIPLVCESRSKSDDTGESNTKSDKFALSFRNFLMTDTKSSTPIKSRETAVKLDNYIAKDAPGSAADNKAEVNVARTSDQPDIYSSVRTSSSNLDLQKSVLEGSDSRAALYVVSSKRMPNTNILDHTTSLGISSNVPVGSCVARAHVKFSRTLKRDRRRPISMIVID